MKKEELSKHDKYQLEYERAKRAGKELKFTNFGTKPKPKPSSKPYSSASRSPQRAPAPSPQPPPVPVEVGLSKFSLVCVV